MSNINRTDLALEAKEQNGEISGVEMEQEQHGSAVLTRVRVVSEEGSRRIGKPIGTYITIEQKDLYEKNPQDAALLSACIAAQIRSLLPGLSEKGTALIVGLGNRDLTPDSLGPRVVSQLFVTRHVCAALPDMLDERVRPVCAIAPGVMAETGMETGEVVRAVVEAVQPDCIIVVDALAARSTQRILSTVQITDAGVAPGSGVGNHRTALTQQTLGVPVIAVGVPMVVHAATILRDALEKLIGSDEKAERLLQSLDGENLVVTPVMIDEAVHSVSSLVAQAIDAALQPQLSEEELRAMRI